MKNTIRIDLTQFNNDKIVEIAKLYNLNLNSLLLNKSNNYHTLFINDGNVIAYTTKRDKTTIMYSTFMTDILNELKPVVLLKKTKSMTVDSLLDKVSKYGIDSLNENEKKFLDNI